MKCCSSSDIMDNEVLMKLKFYSETQVVVDRLRKFETTKWGKCSGSEKINKKTSEHVHKLLEESGIKILSLLGDTNFFYELL